jgi:hypothetical protein
MTFIAIDPGTTQSAIVVFDSPQKVLFVATEENDRIENRLRRCCYDWHTVEKKGYEHLAIEMVASYGASVGEEVFETCLWIGRFIGAFNGPTTKLKRHEIKMALCHTMKGVNDSVIRQRLIDLYGGKDKAIGKKKTPGPLYSLRGDEWQALAVAVVWCEQHQKTLAAS